MMAPPEIDSAQTGRGGTKPLRLVGSAMVSALALFIWGALSHIVLIRGIGFESLPNEGKILPEMSSSIPRDGLYFFPGVDFSRTLSKEETSASEARYRTANGFVVIHRATDGPVSPPKLIQQFLCDLMASLFAALIVSQLPPSFWRRVLAVGSMGIFGCLGVSSLFWTWYGFGDPFFAAHCFDKIAGWFIAGIVLTLCLRKGDTFAPRRVVPSP